MKLNESWNFLALNGTSHHSGPLSHPTKQSDLFLSLVQAVPLSSIAPPVQNRHEAMLQSYRRFSIVLLLAYYATLALCGPGGHALSGNCHGTTSAIGSCHASEGCTIPPSPAVSAIVQGTSYHVDDCLFCSYFAQSQVCGSPTLVECAGHALALEVPRTRLFHPVQDHSLSHPRAPPNRSTSTN